jgi:hypothetical protein
LKLLEHTLLFCNLGLAHFTEHEIVFADISHAEVVNFGHGEAFGRANRGAKAAEAALAHINVEFRRVDPLRGTIGCLPDFLDGPNGLDVDAINGADFGAFVANNAVVDLIVKAVPAIVRNGLHFVWVLDGGDPGPLFEVFRRLNSYDGLRLSRPEEVPYSYA